MIEATGIEVTYKGKPLSRHEARKRGLELSVEVMHAVLQGLPKASQIKSEHLCLRRVKVLVSHREDWN